MSDMEWQCRNWLYFTWLSGDHIVEQHVHNIDVMNWAFGAHAGQGHGHGRPPGPDGPGVRQHLRPLRRRVRVPERRPRRSACAARSTGCADRVEEKIVGTKGYGLRLRRDHRRRTPGSSRATSPTPTSQEHTDLIASIRAGKPLNEGRQVAESTLSAIMGRMSAYTGRAICLGLGHERLQARPRRRPSIEFGPNPVDPVAVPGMTPLV